MPSSKDYELKTGQINFENTNNRGAYACIVIKNGVFHNMTEPLRELLLEALQKPKQPLRAETSIEDMF